MLSMLKVVARAIIAVLCLFGLVSLLFAIVVAVKLHRATASESTASHSSLEEPVPSTTLEDRYLDLMKRVLTRYDFGENYRPVRRPKNELLSWAYYPLNTLNNLARSRGLQLVEYTPFDPEARAVGRDKPDAETMVGLRRLDNLQFCVTDVIRRKVPGDLIECGAWRGGSCILMRAILAAYGVKDRVVWVSDSFEGLPKPDPRLNPETAQYWSGGEMAVSLDEVKQNFRRYGLLDDQVRFLKGFFIDTLPKAPIERIAVLRADGDLYESITQTLDYMYPKVAIGGYVIMDDYGDHLPPARKATDDYRKAHNITEPIHRIDWSGAYWRKER
jgi:O-methyltransferase